MRDRYEYKEFIYIVLEIKLSMNITRSTRWAIALLENPSSIVSPKDTLVGMLSAGIDLYNKTIDHFSSM